MRSRSFRRVALAAAAILIVACASCNRSPASPSPAAQPSPSPQPAPAPSPPPSPSPAPANVVALALVAPPELAPGESVQLIANAVKSDGSVENVSTQAQWSGQSFPAGSTAITVTATGLATGGNSGRGVVTARFGGFAANAEIFVLPRGTFRLTGRITAGALGLENVLVAVIAGTGTGLTARTDVAGNYELYGVAGAVQIRASKEGYLDRAQSVAVAAHASLTFELAPFAARSDYAGVYTLIITAGTCVGEFPEALKRRVYTARVAQSPAGDHSPRPYCSGRHKIDAAGGCYCDAADTGLDQCRPPGHSELRVSVAEADPQRATFGGAATPAGDVTFIIEPAYGYDAPDELVERLSDGSSLAFWGIIAARSTAAGISGIPANESTGGIAYYATADRGSRIPAPATAQCAIDRFDMVPR